ncbi:MAG: hypothetical protein MZU91_13490 [Desulfosudis oleivorans]|nr:hypothetical protein [Desulfosudis oleivorans]
MIDRTEEIWADADMVVKVKEPIEVEYEHAARRAWSSSRTSTWRPMRDSPASCLTARSSALPTRPSSSMTVACPSCCP